MRVYLNEVDPAAFRQVPIDEFHAAMPQAAYVQVEPDFGAQALAVQGAPTIGTIEQEWSGFVETQDLAGLDRDRVRVMGERFLVEAKGEDR